MAHGPMPLDIAIQKDGTNMVVDFKLNFEELQTAKFFKKWIRKRKAVSL